MAMAAEHGRVKRSVGSRPSPGWARRRHACWLDPGRVHSTQVHRHALVWALAALRCGPCLGQPPLGIDRTRAANAPHAKRCVSPVWSNEGCDTAQTAARATKQDAGLICRQSLQNECCNWPNNGFSFILALSCADLTGEVAERFNALVLKTSVGFPYRGFESHPLRQSSTACSAASAVQRQRRVLMSASGVSLRNAREGAASRPCSPPAQAGGRASAEADSRPTCAHYRFPAPGRLRRVPVCRSLLLCQFQ